MPIIVFFEYLAWQYGDGVNEYLLAWRNIHWFLWRAFSVPLLLRTLFAPFRRTGESYKRGFDPSTIAQTFMVNMVTRLVGMVVKVTLLGVALLLQAAAAGVGAFFALVFILAPVAVPASIVVGIILMFSAIL